MPSVCEVTAIFLANVSLQQPERCKQRKTQTQGNGCHSETCSVIINRREVSFFVADRPHDLGEVTVCDTSLPLSCVVMRMNNPIGCSGTTRSFPFLACKNTEKEGVRAGQPNRFLVASTDLNICNVDMKFSAINESKLFNHKIVPIIIANGEIMFYRCHRACQY